jgi:hypothetical protein
MELVDPICDSRQHGFRYGNGAPGGATVSEMSKWDSKLDLINISLTFFTLTLPHVRIRQHFLLRDEMNG